MNISIIPALVLVAIIFLSGPSETKPIPKKSAKFKEKVTAIKVERPPTNEEIDYRVIYDYITSKYKRIKKEDAAQIASKLIEYGRKHQLDPKFAAAVIARESGFNKKAISVTGAKGLGQIKDFNFPSLKINEPYNINQNVRGTVMYLKEMLSKWNTKSEKVALALASYYKGYGAISRGNCKMDPKTKNYVKDILKYYDDLIARRKNHDAKYEHRL